MATDLDVVNAALIRLGEKTLVQLSPPANKPARIASATFAEHRDFLIAEHPWNFATARASLPASATPPAFGYLRAFPLPADTLRVWELFDANKDDNWAVERHLGAKAIYTDLPAPLKVVLIQRVTDLSQATVGFRDALALYCAYQWAEAITGTTALKADLLEEFRLKMSAARSMDGQEGSPLDAVVRGSWLDVR